MSRKGIERFVSVQEVAERMSRKWHRDLEYEVRERQKEEGVILYRWAKLETLEQPGIGMRGVKHFVTVSDANKIMTVDAYAFDTEPHKYQETYTAEEIAKILGVTRMRVYQMRDEGVISLSPVHTDKVTEKRLREYFGVARMENADLPRDRSYFTVEDISLALSMPRKRIEEAISSGALRTTSKTSRYACSMGITHDAFLRWIRGHEETNVMNERKVVVHG